ncbi:pirin-like C-terminal cupin domain-containing protein [Uliginosibacterium aquaticum]|uniref:Pirin family protein n=1 Tax=Uliginosibacterium aquaticum TaxID=2731212 RepID=A0ABX2IHR6_9RHOO|nr:pirin-like C-terminal cupin domain-containing protein [Uliginosibacterium aquaticum]NSL54552.1 pirin family protein [Uliginosibacterium aquaticum]
MQYSLLPMRRENHGSHMRACRLHGCASLMRPFIGMDHCWLSAPTAQPQPPAGIALLSYLFLDSETGLRSRDASGNSTVIQPGGARWLAADRTYMRESSPAQAGRTVHVLHIYLEQTVTCHSIALDLEAHEVPVLELPGKRIRLVLGKHGKLRSPLAPPTASSVLDVTLDPDEEFTMPISAGATAFVIPVFGCIEINNERFSSSEMQIPVYLGSSAQQQLTLRASGARAKFMLVAGGC